MTSHEEKKEKKCTLKQTKISGSSPFQLQSDHETAIGLPRGTAVSNVTTQMAFFTSQIQAIDMLCRFCVHV